MAWAWTTETGPATGDRAGYRRPGRLPETGPASPTREPDLDMCALLFGRLPASPLSPKPGPIPASGARRDRSLYGAGLQETLGLVTRY